MTGHAARDVSAEVAPPDLASSIPTLVGSLCSLLATITVIFLWTFAGGKKRHDFRYALILNLTVAEFLNSLNNSVSGIWVISRERSPSRGLLCEVNGWAGQFSVQAVDFSILAITLVTLLTIQLRSFVIYASTTTKTLICLAIWVIPTCTSIYAWTKGYYGPVSGNWCWIEKQFLQQRYTLNHGWRFAIFFITMCTYVFVFIYMSRRLKPQSLSNMSSSIPDDLDYDKIRPSNDNAPLAGCGSTPRISLDGKAMEDELSGSLNGKHYRRRSSFSFARPLQITTNARAQYSPAVAVTIASPDDTSPISPPDAYPLADMKKPAPVPILPTYQSQRSKTSKSSKNDREIWKMLFLNMYPVTYVILWIPGIANRIAEAMGYDIRALVIMQSSTQFIGLVNACIYIYKEHLRNKK